MDFVVAAGVAEAGLVLETLVLWEVALSLQLCPGHFATLGLSAG